MVATESSQPQRTELILRQIDSLPTLPSVATRLLSLTASEESHIQEVVDLISADPALTSKVLALCRTAERGVASDTLTVERAVVLLGFNTVRNAVLSVKVFEAFEDGGQGSGAAQHGSGSSDQGSGRAERSAGKTGSAARASRRASNKRTNQHPQASAGGSQAETTEEGFDRIAFWSHSLAVGVIAELIAEQTRRQSGIQPSEAFVCGLLHDVGKLALHHILPKSYQRVVELAALNQGNIAEYERRVVGLDHHTAGKRLAEQWQLPHRLQDCIWLHGGGPAAVPALDHRELVGLISVADVLARHQHLGYSGNHPLKQSPEALAEQWGFDPAVIEQVRPAVYDRFEARCRALGLHDAPSQELFVQSMQRANETLGRLNSALQRRSQQATAQAQVLEAISSFHSQASPAQTVQDVLDAVAGSAPKVLGEGFLAVVCPSSSSSGRGEDWLISQYAGAGRLVRSQYVAAPPNAPDLKQLDATQPMAMHLMGLMPWLSDYLMDADDLRQVQILPLSSGWGTAALVLHDRSSLPGWSQLSALASSWGAAIAAAGQHEGARRLGEQLAEANSALAEAQDRLLKQQSLARLGEMAAGAAHEMNNPLAVISGRSQLLTMALPGQSKERQAAQTIFQAAHQLSDLISALRMFADPPEPKRKANSLKQVLHQAVRKVEARRPRGQEPYTIELAVSDELPTVEIDPTQVQKAVAELLNNAVEAAPASGITVRARLEPGEQAMWVQVSDDGQGMDPYTLDHAMDPFFSAKEAGRQMGMGLPRAQQWIAGHGGTLALRSTDGQGTAATFTLPLQSPPPPADTASGEAKHRLANGETNQVEPLAANGANRPRVQSPSP
jgi:signal transduction histidine kinase/HD-like signal output (HDOD) protein